MINTIRTLKGQAWSKRRIARELQIDRQTVRRYLAEEVSPKSPTISTPGYDAVENQNYTFSTPDSDSLSGVDPTASHLPERASRQNVNLFATLVLSDLWTAEARWAPIPAQESIAQL